MKNFIMTVLTALIIPVAFSNAMADDHDLTPINIPTVQTVKAGDTKVIPLPRYAYIDRLTLEVNTGFFCGTSSFQVSFDGYNTQNVEGTGGLRGYRTKILKVNVRTRNLEIYNSTKCTIKVRSIQILPRRWSETRNRHGHGHGHGHGPVYVPVSDAAAQVSFLLETYIYLEGLVSNADRTNYITPAKKAIGKAMAVLNTTPETSQASLAAIKNVLEELRAGREFIDRMATIEATFEAAQEIQSVETALSRMIH